MSDTVEQNSVIQESQPVDTGVQEQEQPVERDYKTEYENLQMALTEARAREKEALSRAEIIERLAFSQQPQAASEPEPEFDPAYIPDVASVDKIVEKKLAPVIDGYRNQQLLLQEMHARNAHQDWDNVFQFYKTMAESDPELHKMVMASKNPAERAYQFGKTHPDYQKSVASSAAGQVVDRITQNLSTPATLNNVSGASPTTQVDYMKMSRDQFMSEVNNLMGR